MSRQYEHILWAAIELIALVWLLFCSVCAVCLPIVRIGLWSHDPVPPWSSPPCKQLLHQCYKNTPPFWNCWIVSLPWYRGHSCTFCFIFRLPPSSSFNCLFVLCAQEHGCYRIWVTKFPHLICRHWCFENMRRLALGPLSQSGHNIFSATLGSDVLCPAPTPCVIVIWDRGSQLLVFSMHGIGAQCRKIR